MATKLADAPISKEQTCALLRELVRAAVAAMLARQEAPFDELESKAHPERLARQNSAIEAALRERDWLKAAEVGSTAADFVGVSSEDLRNPVLARAVLATAPRLISLALQVEGECGDPLHLGKEMLREVGLAPERTALMPPMLLSVAVETACVAAPPDVEKKIRAVGRLATAFFGDVPVASLSFDKSADFLKFVWSMPKDWGKAHGKNRFERNGKVVDLLDLKQRKDSEDETLVAEVLSDNSLSVPDKRRRLIENLN